MQDEYITTQQLASRINYDERTIRESLKDSVLSEGRHYIRPFGGRKILFLWSAIERDMGTWSKRAPAESPWQTGRFAMSSVRSGSARELVFRLPVRRGPLPRTNGFADSEANRKR